MSSCSEIDSCLQQFVSEQWRDSLLDVKEHIAESTFDAAACQKTNSTLDFIDSVFELKANIIDSAFNNSLTAKLGQLDSAMRDSLMSSQWCSFFSQSLDKVIATHVGLFTALITIAVAIFLTKYWFDNNKFNSELEKANGKWNEEIKKLKDDLVSANDAKKELEEMQKKLSEEVKKIKDDLTKAEETRDDLKKQYENNNTMLTNFTNDLLASKQLYDRKIDLYVKVRMLDEHSPVGEIDDVLSDTCAHLVELEKFSFETMCTFVAWIEEKKVFADIFMLVNNKEMSEKRKLHSIVLDLKKYTDKVNDKLQGQLDFQCIDDFFSQFQTDDSM